MKLLSTSYFIAALLMFGLPGLANAGDNHAGYYYPDPQTSEVYVSPLTVLPAAGKRSRIGFTVGLHQQQTKRAFAPGFHLFAKGARAEKLIIVATGPGQYDTLYRLRALLAAMSAEARNSPLFAQSPQPENLNFLDLVRMAGFETVILSNGSKIAHRINITGAD